jgi:hypothetical protein
MLNANGKFPPRFVFQIRGKCESRKPNSLAGFLGWVLPGHQPTIWPAAAIFDLIYPIRQLRPQKPNGKVTILSCWMTEPQGWIGLDLIDSTTPSVYRYL